MSRSSPIRIGIDGRELLGESTGVGRYLAELLTRWAARDDASRRELIVYTPDALPLLETIRGVRQEVAPGGSGTWWEQTRLRRAVRAGRPDVFFAPAYTAPLALHCPLVVTIHDVSFAAHPEWFRLREGARRRFVTRQTAHAASAVLTDSEFSRREIEQRLDVPPERVTVIPPGVTRRTGCSSSARGPLVLFVGSIFNRRRLPDTIRAFALARADHPTARLVIVGSDRTYPAIDLRAIARDAGVSDSVEIRPYAPEAELNELYSRAKVFVFLSKYEGFGLTPLEALSAGVPIVVLDTPVAREVYGNAAIYINPADAVQGAARAMRELLSDLAAGLAVLAHSDEVLARYSWEDAANRTLAVIEAAGAGA
jgi:glycosyltransferase involved in cell wall biosynthesis